MKIRSLDLAKMLFDVEGGEEMLRRELEETTAVDEGSKDDNEKVRLELISPYAEWGLGEVLSFGARKYAPRNWEKGIHFSRVIGAIRRHLNAIERGEDRDPETGLLHADHLFTEAMFLSHFQHLPTTYSRFDDRQLYHD